MSDKKGSFMYKIEWSAVLTLTGIVLLFSSAVIVTLIAPGYLDSTWVEPTSAYQVQMYEVADPHIYFSSLSSRDQELQSVYHLEKNKTLMAFKESENVRFISEPQLEKFITRFGDDQLKLTSDVLLLRSTKSEKADTLKKKLQDEWRLKNPNFKEEGKQVPAFDVLELFAAKGDEAFAIAPTDRILEDWIDENFVILDKNEEQKWYNDPGVIYINNPREYRVRFKEDSWEYDPNGEEVESVEQLTSQPLGFRSRKELIALGEHIYAIEGCWYCHTDQTRTLIQDVVLNGSDSFPAPPSSANEYIYQNISFPGTQRIGPDLSRVGVKKPSRDWHQSHFWSPKTASKGSIMPAFQHFFDYDPRGTSRRETGIPNYKFEAVYQYLMTKGTRITSPNEAWWLGKDPVNTIGIIEGRKND